MCLLSAADWQTRLTVKLPGAPVGRLPAGLGEAKKNSKLLLHLRLLWAALDAEAGLGLVLNRARAMEAMAHLLPLIEEANRNSTEGTRCTPDCRQLLPRMP